jgi:hypothetical protein
MTASWTTTRARTWTWVAAATWTPPWFKKNIVFQKTNLIIGLRISSTPWSAFCNFNCYSESYIDALCFYAAWNIVAFRHFTRVPEVWTKAQNEPHSHHCLSIQFVDSIIRISWIVQFNKSISTLNLEFLNYKLALYCNKPWLKHLVCVHIP